MYCVFNILFEKPLILAQNIRNLLNFRAKYSTSFVCKSKAFGYMFLIQNIQKESDVHPIYLKSISLCPKKFEKCQNSIQTFENYLLSAPNIGKVFLRNALWKFNIRIQNLWKIWYPYTKPSKSMSFGPKIFDKYFILVQNIWRVSDLGPKYSTVLIFNAKYSTNVVVVRKIFEEY